MNKYIVNEKFDFELEKDSSVDLVKVGNNTYHMLINDVAYGIEILEYDSNINMYSVKIDGRKFKIEVKNRLHQLLADMGMDSAATEVVKEIPAPMPGIVIDVLIEIGASISKGDSLLVLEAMKMENVLKSPTDGVVKSILVKKGQNVDKNDVMIIFE